MKKINGGVEQKYCEADCYDGTYVNCYGDDCSAEDGKGCAHVGGSEAGGWLCDGQSY